MYICVSGGCGWELDISIRRFRVVGSRIRCGEESEVVHDDDYYRDMRDVTDDVMEIPCCCCTERKQSMLL